MLLENEKSSLSIKQQEAIFRNLVIQDRIDLEEIAWKRSRLGRITASRFADIQLTESKEIRHEKGTKATKKDKLEYIEKCNVEIAIEKPTLADIDPIYLACPPSEIIAAKLTKTAETYMNELIGEVMTGQQGVEITARALDWGNKYEPVAIEEYETRKGFVGENSDLAIHPKYDQIGSTADRLFRKQKGLAETKCPANTRNHIKTVRSKQVPSIYRDQVIGQLLCNAWAEWNDFVSFDPRVIGAHRLVIVRILRADVQDEIDALENRLITFLEIYLAELDALGLDFNNIPNT